MVRDYLVNYMNERKYTIIREMHAIANVRDEQRGVVLQNSVFRSKESIIAVYTYFWIISTTFAVHKHLKINI